MTRHLHAPANALLYQALDLPADERQAFIAEACAGAPELLELVRTLLSRIDQLDAFLESPIVLPHVSARPPAPLPQAGDTVGKWRVIRELGRGGMGLILLVRRDDGAVEQLAALKIIQHALSAQALALFHRERQIVANLSHPDIARLIDAGSGADERPWFVMEYSEGLPIDRYCAEQRLPLNARIALFVRVCRAVHHAHQRLVIHRDLKPANMLVAADGTLKLVDFGVASLLDGELAGVDQPAPMTPQFASPEQLAGKALTVGSDLYSLGVVLYGLLTGQSPFAETNPLASRPHPTLPSRAVTSGERGTAPLASDEVLAQGRKLARQLRGDLDQILLTAIAADPAARYASADAFADDLQRYLDKRPVSAARPTWRYRARKLVQRAPWTVAAATFAACSLVAGTGVALWQARQADRARDVAEMRFEQTRTLARTMLFELNDSLEKGPTAAREKLVSTALAYLHQLATDKHMPPELRRDVASAYERIGDIVGNQVGDNLGRAKQAQGYYEEALRLRAAGGNALEDVTGRREVQRRLGDIAVGQGRVDDARRYYDLAIASARQAAAMSHQPQDLIELFSRRRYGAAILYTRGQPSVGDLASALTAFAALKKESEAFIAANPANADVAKVYVPVLSQLVDLQRVIGKLDDALATARVSLALAAQKVKTAPDDPRWRRQLTVTQRQIGDILVEQGHAADGLAQIREALAVREDIAARDKANERAARDVAIGHSAVADALLATRDYAGAEHEFNLALAMFEAQAKTNASAKGPVLELQIALANVQHMQHRGAQAVAALRQVKQTVEEMGAKAAGDAQLQARIALLEAQIQPGGTAAQAYAAAMKALPVLLESSEHDPRDTYLQRESASAWQKVGEIGLRARQNDTACAYLDLAEKRYADLAQAKRLNAIDAAQRQTLATVRQACGG